MLFALSIFTNMYIYMYLFICDESSHLDYIIFFPHLDYIIFFGHVSN